MEVKEKNRKSLFQRVMFLSNIVAIIFLLFSYAASFISPEKIRWLALFGLGYGILLFINLVFIIFWLLVRKKKYLYSLAVILIGISNVFNIFGIHLFSGAHRKKNELSFPIKVMSYNVRLFDLYNWMHNSETREKIFRFIGKESPDIICFQEYFTSDNPGSEMVNNEPIKKLIPAPYAHIAYSTTMRETDHWGIATFSKYPIINKQMVRFQKEGGDIFIFSDIVVGRDTIRIYNTHLESFHFKLQDYKFIENLGSDVEQDEVKGSLNIISRLERAFVKRATQVEILHQHILGSPFPVIICGDFNDTPSSYAYSTMSKGLKDAFRESGAGFGKTYAGTFPSFRIDYILHDQQFKSTGYRTIYEKLSDHYPISCWIEKK